MLLNRAEFLERLTENVVEVNFTKVNGEARSLHCTLQPELIPNFDEAKLRKEISRTSDEPVMSLNKMNVWDVENEGWRSFHLDRVTSVLTPAPKRMQTEVS